MSERPVEELIGWTRAEGWPNAEWIEWHDPGRDSGTGRSCAEEGDLAAWLAARGDQWEVRVQSGGGQVIASMWLPNDTGTGWHGPYSTIREALVAAVRKVADL